MENPSFKKRVNFSNNQMTSGIRNQNRILDRGIGSQYTEFELPKYEIESIKERFSLFDRTKTGFIFDYQVPMLFKGKSAFINVE